MTEEMKSDIISGISSKHNSKALQHRRKLPLSRTSLLNLNASNGGGSTENSTKFVNTNVNLAAAYHDHLSCTKYPSDRLSFTKERKNSVKDSYTYSDMTASRNENDLNGGSMPQSSQQLTKSNSKLCTATGANKDKNSDLNRLKELLCINLQFIKQQNDMLFVKEQHITNLKCQEESLRAKIHKLEEQIKAESKKTNREKPKGRVAVRNYSRSVSRTKNIQRSVNASVKFINKRKKKYLNNRYAFNKKQKLVHSGDGDRLRTSIESSNLVPKPGLSVKCQDENEERKQEPFLQTNLNYFMYNDCYRDDDDNDDDADHDLSTVLDNSSTGTPINNRLINHLTDSHNNGTNDDCPSAQSHVLVPTWRINLVTSCYSMEGTENLDDDVFYKRHLKFEMAEKRRKRWDIQRIRELRMADKLKQRYDRANDLTKKKYKQKKGQSSSTVTTFYHGKRKVQIIEMIETEGTPVLALNHVIPVLAEEEFAFSWSDEETDDCDNSKSLKKFKSSTSDGL